MYSYQRRPCLIIPLGMPGGAFIYGIPPPAIIFYAISIILPIPPAPPAPPIPPIIFSIMSYMPPIPPSPPPWSPLTISMMLPMPPICFNIWGSKAFYNWLIACLGFLLNYFEKLRFLHLLLTLSMLSSRFILPIFSTILENFLCSPSKNINSLGC